MSDLDSLKLQVAIFAERLDSVEKRIDELKDKIDFLYNAVDTFMKEIMTNREERVFINSRLDRHENRISLLEQFNRRHEKAVKN